MRGLLQNVYDAIDDFYTHDPNWNELLPRETVENYFRQRAWQGAHDFQLQKEWKVLSQTSLAWAPIMRSTRSRISAAALLVKVMASML